MRTPRYLSHTALAKFETNREEYYLQYCHDDRPPRQPQTRPMSVGAAFDAYIKSYLYKRLFGQDDKFNFEQLFEAQVEPQNRDWAQYAGAHVFNEYKEQGCCADLLLEMERSDSTPVFELRLETDIKGIPVVGHPDLRYTTKNGTWIIRDWKVNGYCSKGNTSPKKGYILLQPGGKVHKLATVHYHDGIEVSTPRISDIYHTWNDQLIMYGWMLGCEIGSDFIIGIEQCVGKGGPDYPDLRFARFQSLATGQQELWNRLQHCWNSVSAGYIFNGIAPSREDSDRRCKELDAFYSKPDTPADAWLQDLSRDQSYRG